MICKISINLLIFFLFFGKVLEKNFSSDKLMIFCYKKFNTSFRKY